MCWANLLGDLGVKKLPQRKHAECQSEMSCLHCRDANWMFNIVEHGKCKLQRLQYAFLRRTLPWCQRGRWRPIVKSDQTLPIELLKHSFYHYSWLWKEMDRIKTPPCTPLQCCKNASAREAQDLDAWSIQHEGCGRFQHFMIVLCAPKPQATIVLSCYISYQPKPSLLCHRQCWINIDSASLRVSRDTMGAP